MQRIRIVYYYVQCNNLEVKDRQAEVPYLSAVQGDSNVK